MRISKLHAEHVGVRDETDHIDDAVSDFEVLQFLSMRIVVGTATSFGPTLWKIGSSVPEI